MRDESLPGAAGDSVNHLLRVVRLLHSSPDSIGIANCLASDPVQLLRCRRISVTHRAGGLWSVAAATGVSQPEPRAEGVREICQTVIAAESAARTGKQDGNIWVVPLPLDSGWIHCEWAAVIEWSDTPPESRTLEQLEQILLHASLALSNLERQQTLRLWQRLTGKALKRRVLFSAVVMLIALISGLWPVELQIEVTGSLVPATRQYCFAPESGVISEIGVHDGQSVAKGDILCQLQNEDLELQAESIEGEISSSRARLTAIESLRTDRGSGQSGLLSAEQAEISERLKALENQLHLLTERRQRLTVRANFSGQVFGRHLQETLARRPVERGQFLFELADSQAGWNLEFRIPEPDVRHVLEAASRAGNPLAAECVLETNPELRFSALIEQIGMDVQLDESGMLSTRAVGIADPSSFSNPRPGAGLFGRIRCGKRSLGFVVFRRLIESLQRHMWL